MEHKSDDKLNRCIPGEFRLIIPIKTLYDCSMTVTEIHDDGNLSLRIRKGEFIISGLYLYPRLALKVTEIDNHFIYSRHEFDTLVALLEQAEGIYSATCLWNVRSSNLDFGIERVTVQDGKVIWEDITP